MGITGNIGRRLFAIAILASGMVNPACTCQGPLPPFDPPTANCEMPDPVLDTSRLDPCVQGELLGTFTLQREAGPPDPLDESVDVPEGRVCVRVLNQGAASARIALGATELFVPSDFNPQVLQLQRVVETEAGSESLTIRLTSTPGSTLRVELRALSATPDPRVVAAETDLGELQRMVCDEFNLNIDALLDPEVAAAVTAGLLEGGRPLGRMLLHRNAYGIPSFIGPLPVADSPSMPGASPEAIARDWAMRHAALMRLAGSDLMLDHQDSGSAGETTVVFGQQIGALPVFDSVLAFFIDNLGVVREIRANLVPASELALRSAPLTEADAMVRAETELAARGITPHTAPFAVEGIHDLSVSTFRRGLAVAWMVRYAGEVSVFVDAGTGEVREVRSEESSDFYIHVAQLLNPGQDYPTAIRPNGSVTTRIRTTPAQPGDLDGPVVDNDCFLDPPAPPGEPPGNRDPTCTILVGNLTRADFFYRTVWGRDGWSNAKASRRGEYALIYGEPTDANGNLSCYPGSSVSTAGCHATTRRRVAIGGAFLSADAVTHEFGHGFLWDPTSRVRTVASDGLSLTGQGYLGEHVGDVIAGLTHLSISGGTSEEAFRASGAEGRSVRDNTLFRCEGYHLPTPDSMPGEPPPEPPCDSEDVLVGMASPAPFGCREYTHMDFLANLDGPGEVHVSSCMYSHVGYLLSQEGAVPRVRGVATPGGISRELLAEFYRKLYSAPHTSPRVDDYWDYASAFRTVIGIVIGNCASGSLGGIPECDVLSAAGAGDRITMASELTNRFTAALWAEGFWSDPDLLAWRSDISPVIVNAPAAGSSAMALHAFYIDGSDMLQMVTYDDPTDAGRTESGPFDLSTLAGTPVRTNGPMGVAVSAGGDIRLAYVDSLSGQVSLLSRVAGSWSTTSLLFSTAAEQGLAITVLDDGRSLIVAATGGQLDYYFDDSSALEGRVRSRFGTLASQPSLTRVDTPAGPKTLLAFVSPDAVLTIPAGRLEYQVFDSASATFSSGDQLRVLSSPGTSPFAFSLDTRSERTPENLAASSCPGGISDCNDFVGTDCVGFLSTHCELKSCATDLDCIGVAGTSGGGHVSCVAGTCGSFTRFAITAREVGGWPTLLPFTDSDGLLRVHVFIPSSRAGDAGDSGGLTFANLLPIESAGSIDFDEFHASRQVRLADDAFYARGYAAAGFDGPTRERVDVVLGVDAGGLVRLIWRRSE